MNKEEFSLRWSAAERWSGSSLWIFYSSGLVAAGLAIVAGLGLLAIQELRPLATTVIAVGAAGFGTLMVVGWSWRRWLKRSGMVCPSCGHHFNRHTGTRLIQPGVCDVCEANGPCRRTPLTGKCDKCGAQVFEP
jgi:hypothetical protein